MTIQKYYNLIHVIDFSEIESKNNLVPKTALANDCFKVVILKMLDFSPLKDEEAVYECYEDICFQVVSRNRRSDVGDSYNQEDDNRMCDLTCKCSPGLSNSIAQKSSTSQESSQEQTVELKTALGYGSIALAACLLIVLGMFSTNK